MEDKKVKLYKIGIILCIISLYFLPHRLRASYNYYLAQFNILFYLGFYIFLRQTKSQNPKESKSSNIIWNLIVLTILGLLVYKSHNYSWIYEKLRYFVSVCFPVVIISKLLYSKNPYLEEFSMSMYKALKFVCYILVASWLFDQVFNNVIQNMIANYYDAANLYACLRGHRFISIYGHPLANAILMFSLLFWTLTLNNNKIEVKNYALTIIISIIGIAITGSKSIIVLAAILICIYMITKKNYKYIVLIGIIAFAFYKFGLFDVTLSRLSQGLISGDMSSGRNTSIIRLMENGTLRFKLLYGYEINSRIAGLIPALEYPILRWAYNSGIIFTIIICIYYFIMPLIEAFKTRNFRFFLAFITFIFAVNTQDGIASDADSLIMFITSSCFLIYIVRSKKNKLCLEGSINEKENKSNDANSKP